MKKIFCLVLVLVLNLSCESKREGCIKDLVDNEGYSYDEACEACDTAANDAVRR